jgi:crotonobetainyl-CoA:carnitine CoA-transferase CaiB-like acyl-CoA transferase
MTGPDTRATTTSAAERGPLSGVRVLDLTMNMSGPFATMLLADQGADVLKVEPPDGDPIRSVGTGRGGMSGYFANLNRNKRSVRVDLTAASGLDMVLALTRDADVFIQNFRLGVIDRLGLGADQLMEINPRLVYASISGFGVAGPMAEMPAYDHVVQALSGIADAQGDVTGVPTMVLHGLVDKTAGYTTAQAVTAALFARATTGRGATIHVSMLDAALELLWPDGMMNYTCLDDVDVMPPISRSFRLTPKVDGYLAVVALTTQQWQGMVRAVLGTEPDATGGIAERMQTGGAVMREVRQALGAMTTDVALEKLQAAGVPCAPVLARSELAAHPQIEASESTAVVDHPTLGRIRQAMPAAHFDGRRATPRPAPMFGAENERLEGHLDASSLWEGPTGAVR